jgi:hypothetical protein
MNKHFILILCFTCKILLIHIIRIARLILPFGYLQKSAFDPFQSRYLHYI